MQTAIEPKPLRLGILPMMTSLLEDMFSLPEGYHIVGVSYDAYNRILNFTLTSEQLPEVEEGRTLPQLQIHVTSEAWPDAPPQYRKITTEVKII